MMGSGLVRSGAVWHSEAWTSWPSLEGQDFIGKNKGEKMSKLIKGLIRSGALEIKSHTHPKKRVPLKRTKGNLEKLLKDMGEIREKRSRFPYKPRTYRIIKEGEK